MLSLICSDHPKSGPRVWPRAQVPRAAPAPGNSTQASGRPARCRRRGILQSVPARPRVTLLPREGGGLLGVPRSRAGGGPGWSRRTPRQTHSAPLTAGRSIPRLEFQRTGRAAAPPRALRRAVSAKSRARPAGIARAWAGRQVPGLRRLPGLAPLRGPTAPRPPLSPLRALAAFELLTFCQLPSDGETKTNTFFLGQWLFPVPAQKDGGGAATIKLGGESQARIAAGTPQMSPQSRGWLGRSLEGALGLSPPALPFALIPRVGGRGRGGRRRTWVMRGKAGAKG